MNDSEDENEKTIEEIEYQTTSSGSSQKSSKYFKCCKPKKKEVKWIKFDSSSDIS